MKLSVVITTRNEAANIANCINAFEEVREAVEVIVVDNSSEDETKSIATGLGAKVFDKGPERNAQRNFGWRQASSDWVVILDADMILPRATIDEMLAIAGAAPTGDEPTLAYWIPEVRSGSGLRTKARNFERSFYDGTCIDALRLLHRSVLERVDGFDERLIAGAEDWDLDIRILALGVTCAILKNHLIHNEKKLSLKRMLEKKAYYSKSIADYRAKWGDDHPAVRKQLGFGYRYFGVFVEQGKWKKLLRHPILAAVMYFERIAVGFTYLINR